MANTMNSIEVDPAMMDPNDTDYATSGYETGSTSLSSTVNEYVFENGTYFNDRLKQLQANSDFVGRRYHAYYGTDKNLLPTDETEQDRMDLAHEIVLQLLGGELHKASIVSNPQRILDVGTGTGIWAIDMADKYPSAQVLGTDLSPLQPKWVPPNCSFEVDDAELDWTYSDDSFDFIHFRSVAQGIAKWSQVLREAYRCTRPGGHIELSESHPYLISDDGSLKEDNPGARWSRYLNDAMIASHRTPSSEESFRKRLEKAGFVDVQTFTLPLVVGPWAKDKQLKKLGVMMLLILEQGFHSYGLLAFTKILGMDPKEAEQLCHDAVASTKNKNVHSYFPHYIAIGRKPEA